MPAVHREAPWLDRPAPRLGLAIDSMAPTLIRGAGFSPKL